VKGPVRLEHRGWYLPPDGTLRSWRNTDCWRYTHDTILGAHLISSAPAPKTLVMPLGHPSPLSTPRRLRCLVLGTSPFNPNTEALLLFPF